MRIVVYANGTQAPAPEIPDAEHQDRIRRVRSVTCPPYTAGGCGAAAMKACRRGGGASCQARWDAYYQQAGVS